MAYRSSVGLLLIASAFAFAAGLWRLASLGRWRLVVVISIALLAYPAFLYAVYLIPDRHLRMWTAFVVVLGAPMWLMAGFVVYGFSSRPPDKLLGEVPHVPSHRIRIQGGIALAVGVVSWCVGTFDSDLPREIEGVLLVLALYGLVLGGYWLLSGRKLV